MATHARKNVTIVASQWLKVGDHPAVTVHPYGISGCGWINTKEGGMLVAPGDWIITTIDGKGYYPINDRDFKLLYEEIK